MLTSRLIRGTLTEADVFHNLNDIISLHADFEPLKVIKEAVQLVVGISCLNATTNIVTNHNHDAIKSYYIEILEEILLN